MKVRRLASELTAFLKGLKLSPLIFTLRILDVIVATLLLTTNYKLNHFIIELMKLMINYKIF